MSISVSRLHSSLQYALKVALLAMLVTAGLSLASPVTISAESSDVLTIIYSDSCPHCTAARAFLSKLSEDYPDLTIQSLNIAEQSTIDRLDILIERHQGSSQYRGLIPLIFFEETYFVGFSEMTANDIRALVQQNHSTSGTLFEHKGTSTVLPFNIESSTLPAPVLAIVLGIIDGFNVCSVGALMLILSLVVKLRSRRPIIIYGSIFLLITGVVYMSLIFFWHWLFTYIASYINAFEMLVGVLALVGSAYFLSEYRRFKKHGVTCESSSGRIVAAVTKPVTRAFERGRAIGIASAVGLFAVAITIIEFPCSAAVPLTFAGILASLELPPISYAISILLFTLFYLFDEFIVFTIAVLSLRLWSTSGQFVQNATLVAASVLGVLGMCYLM